MLHRIDAHHRVESSVKGELLQADEHESCLRVLGSGLREHPYRPVCTHDPPASAQDLADVRTGAARCI